MKRREALNAAMKTGLLATVMVTAAIRPSLAQGTNIVPDNLENVKPR